MYVEERGGAGTVTWSRCGLSQTGKDSGSSSLFVPILIKNCVKPSTLIWSCTVFTDRPEILIKKRWGSPPVKSLSLHAIVPSVIASTVSQNRVC